MSDAAEFPEPDRLADASHPRDTVDLFGQNHAERTFAESLSTGRLHHGWMITGPVGIGKATLAYRIARHLISGRNDASLSMAPDDPVFRRIAAQSEPGLAVIRRAYDHDRKKLRSVIRVDEVRALRSFFALSATDGGWRVAIIDAADEMNNQAANALLKLLEEPPERCVLLLVTHQPGGMLPTIRSRTRALPCLPLSPDDLTRALAAQGIDGAGPDVHALSDGSVGQAMTLMAADGMAVYGRILDLLNDARSMDRAKVLALGEMAANRKTPAAFGTIIDLTERALARMAKAGSGADTAATPLAAESEIHARFATSPHQARVWADVAQNMRARAMRAHAVNLDPAHVILDTFLSIETAAQAL